MTLVTVHLVSHLYHLVNNHLPMVGKDLSEGDRDELREVGRIGSILRLGTQGGTFCKPEYTDSPLLS